MQHITIVSLIALLTLNLAACNDDDDIKQGVFLDSEVEGLTYTSGDLTGTTDSDGTFKYKSGQQVTFSIGDIVIGTANGAKVITPVELVPEATDASHPTVVNIARFLQTLDDDGNPDNGISILDTVNEMAEGKSINFAQTLEQFSNDNAIQSLINSLTALTNSGERGLVAAAMALSHLQDTLASIVIVDDNNGGNGDGNGNGGASGSGTINLSGTDTSTIGTSLTVGAVKQFNANTNVNTVLIVDKKSTITAENNPMPGDPANAFVIVIFDYGISMTVIKNSQEFDYACTTISSSFDLCGSGFNLDFDNKTISLTNVSVVNTDTDSILQLNGTIKWD